MDGELYRYISFEDFVNLVVNNKERYMQPSLWYDKFEGYLCNCLKDEEDVRRFVSNIYGKLCPNDYDSICAIPCNYVKIWHNKWFAYAQCWSRDATSEAMWRCYSYGNRAIRIRTRADKLEAHAKKVFSAEKFDVCLKQVTYDLDTEHTLEQQINQIKNDLLIYEPYFHKRNVFEHEKEVRLLVTDLKWDVVDYLSEAAMTYKIHERIRDKSDEERIDYLTELIYTKRPDWTKLKEPIKEVRIEDAGDISDFLDGVMVHPLAESWYVDIIRDLCKSRNIPFEGQSEIYKLK